MTKLQQHLEDMRPKFRRVRRAAEEREDGHEKKIEAWHFVRADRRLGYDAREMIVEPGYVYSIEDDRQPYLCAYGMHASVHAWDALPYAPHGPLVVYRVRIWGDVQIGDDKIVGRHREVLWLADAECAIRLHACWCVRQVWHLLADERSRNVVEVAERYARGEATRGELAAAWDAAWDAASAAWAAWAARAVRAVRSAEVEAARAAAWAAEVDGARDAARDAARSASLAASLAVAAAGDTLAAWAAASYPQIAEFERRMLALQPKIDLTMGGGS